MLKHCKTIDHQWYVFDKTTEDRCLLLECHKCRAYGIVTDPNKQEWRDADNASLNPYLWEEGNSRVVIWPPGN